MKADINNRVGQVRSHFESQSGFAFAPDTWFDSKTGMVTLIYGLAPRGRPLGESGCGSVG
jgi:hypothetical protein